MVTLIMFLGRRFDIIVERVIIAVSETAEKRAISISVAEKEE